METIEHTSIFAKKQDELTVADNLKLGLGVTAICLAAPAVLCLGLSYGAYLIAKREARKDGAKLTYRDFIMEK
jgi:hypothetical protein